MGTELKKILQDVIDSVDNIPEIIIYSTLSRHFKNPLYAKRKQRDFKHKFNMDDLLSQVDSDVNSIVVGDYKYVLTPYCLLGDTDDDVYPILLKSNNSIVKEIFYFINKDKYMINKAEE